MNNKILAFIACIASGASLATQNLNLYTCSQDRVKVHLQKRFFTEIYNTIKPLVSSLKESVGTFSSEIADEWLSPHLHQNDPATIRFTDLDELCETERIYTQQRMPFVQSAFTKILQRDIPIEQVPRIALCCSGGGYRAMLFTFGFFKGLQETGLLDCTTYMAGLSGSSWALASWIASQKSLNDYLETLPGKLYLGLEGVKQPTLLYKLAKQLIAKALYGQPLSMIDVYGPTLANTLLADFGEERLNVTFSESHAHLMNGSLPLPIYTAVTPNVEPYEWLEFTPFEIGGSYQKAYIPTWAYGRKFKDGTSTNFAGELPLGYMMGVFGSAFEFDIEDAIRQTSESLNAYIATFPTSVQSVLHRIIDKLINSPLDDVRLAPSSLPNFTYKANACNLNNDKFLTLVDGGMYFNLPFAPLLRKERQVDIILVCDASSDISGCQTLHWAEEYMDRKGLKFPPIDYAEADKQVMTIFKDPCDQTCPIVVYFPCIKNDAYSRSFDPASCVQDGYCGTMNFTYNAAQIDELMGLSEFAVKQYTHELLALAEEAMNRKA